MTMNKRKKRRGDTSLQSLKEPTIPLQVLIPQSLHQALKIKAVSEQVTMTDIVIRCLQENV